jgi:hypothetical protein
VGPYGHRGGLAAIRGGRVGWGFRGGAYWQGWGFRGTGPRGGCCEGWGFLLLAGP